MRTKAGRPSGGRTLGGRLRLLAAFFIPALIAFSTAAAPAASASPSPSPPGSENVDFIVPPGTTVDTDQQMAEKAQQLFDDPMGRALAEKIYSYRYGKGKPADDREPGNVSVQWFDLGSLPSKIYDSVLRALKEANSQYLTSLGLIGIYNLDSTPVPYAGNEKLYEQLGADASSRLLQVSSYNSYQGLHSEQIPLTLLEQVIAKTLMAYDKNLSEAAAIAEANEILQKSPGLASERSPCWKRCYPLTREVKRRLAIAYYGLTDDDHDAAAATIRNIDPKVMVLVGKERSRAKKIQEYRAIGVSEQAIEAEFGLQKGAGTGAQPQSTTPCDPHAAGQPGSGNSQGMALMAFSSGDPCGEGQGTPGGLVKALTSGNLGGVDFSTLQMRYMSDSPSSTGLQYSFSGQTDTSATPQDIGSALNVLTDNAADLRTWLVLNPDEFWVNLNPSEPGRIIDSQLGETNAGRELLDADFQLKRSSATLMNPNTKLGAEYWRDLAGSSSSVCYGSRMWIVPGQVQVREDGGSLYILSAQLAVKAVPDHVADMPASCHYDVQTDARGQRLDQTMIVPLITKMVNTAPEYAPIRRAFMARIVAQWIRDRHASGQRTSFDSLIDSGNIGPAQLQNGWQPQQVFNAYVKSLKDGEFTYNTTFHQGGATYIQKITIGGVDFTSLNPTAVSAAQMNQDYPQLAQTAKLSVSQLTSSDGSLWLGDTLVPPSGSTWSKVTDPVRSFASGRTGILILVLAGLGVAIFGIRRGSRRGRQAT